MKNDITGQVSAGRGLGSTHIKENIDEISAATGETLVHGTLNCLLRKPMRLNESKSIKFDHGQRMLWKIELNGVPAWAYRWKTAPLHVMEVLSSNHLRTHLNLADGDIVELSMDNSIIDEIPLCHRVAWNLCWAGRRELAYTNDRYYFFVKEWCVQNGATQEYRHSTTKSLTMNLIKAALKRIPLPSRVLSLNAKPRETQTLKTNKQPYTFNRQSTDSCGNDTDLHLAQVLNVLNYTKTSETSYSATKFPAGYHTIEVAGVTLEGQRKPAKRLSIVPFDFSGKSILDIGCNQGGMIFEKAEMIRFGIGLDYDRNMINAANKVRAIKRINNADFYVFDVEKDPLSLIKDFLPENSVDIVFLLSVCMWIDNWKEVISFSKSISQQMLFESNGSIDQQEEQHRYLSSIYSNVTLLEDGSNDDAGTAIRSLYFCSD